MMAEEEFDTFDDNGTPSGPAPRSRVHREGLWHRAVHVLVFRPDGDLLLQQRQWDKDVWPGAWDLSAAEHLKPGETFAHGASRGLKEELGIEADEPVPLGATKRFRLDMPEKGIKDHEFQQTFGVLHEGEIVVDPDEVRDIRWIDRERLAAELERDAGRLTPWFRAEIEELDILGSWQKLLDHLFRRTLRGDRHD